MSDALPWLPLYHETFLADTALFSAAEAGAYTFLMLHFWRDGELPADDEGLREIARLSPREWKASRAKLAKRFSPDWRHERLDREREKSADAYRRKVEGGRRGGLARVANLRVVGDSRPLADDEF
ncbi:MAG: DUF1376 domain-containing protein [Roseiarcus sp.]|jgi:uncharacterized protein YdaU (DUF1376 family)